MPCLTLPPDQQEQITTLHAPNPIPTFAKADGTHNDRLLLSCICNDQYYQWISDPEKKSKGNDWGLFCFSYSDTLEFKFCHLNTTIT